MRHPIICAKSSFKKKREREKSSLVLTGTLRLVLCDLVERVKTAHVEAGCLRVGWLESSWQREQRDPLSHSSAD